ncbi:tumor protein D54-like isoform X6 [Scyliorhinus canicula]|uniref:tumor protein D54-like isoform X6 n=2 Tax=Scyliorhinus canicula TaxID=7830 RepID=UPI0018F792CA|nr:tumor protein D54-like isoform X6 [Scyliorhinus canicula]
MDAPNQDINLNSPNKGLPGNMTDVPVDTPASGDGVGVLSEAETEELKSELTKVEDEIATLRQVLVAKERHASEIKRKLGLTPFNELKQNLSKSWQDVQASNAYKKTQATLSTAGSKTTNAISNVGSVLSRTLGEIKSHPFSQSFSSSYSIRHSISMPAMRESPTFKSFEESVGNLKAKVIGNENNSKGGYHTPTASSPSAEEKLPQDNAPF